MLEVVSLVEQLVPGLLRSSRPSVACVCTTRAKFLVFDGDGAHPACVVEFGEAERLMRVERILAELHLRVPEAVARPLVCERMPDGRHVLIQEGLGGVPWFRVSDRLVSAADWQRLLERAAASLVRLHAATGEVAMWSGPVSVCGELASLVGRLEAAGVHFHASVRQGIGRSTEPFRAGASTRGVWQHGDFSLNNLLVSDDRLAIIDFDEFGGTLMPLHDEFGLALSVPLSQRDRSPLSRASCIRTCVKPAIEEGCVTAEQVPALLFHHLLWRIHQSTGLPRRSALRKTLVTWTEELAVAPETFLEGLAPDDGSYLWS
jgi:hypothetical protein